MKLSPRRVASLPEKAPQKSGRMFKWAISALVFGVVSKDTASKPLEVAVPDLAEKRLMDADVYSRSLPFVDQDQQGYLADYIDFCLRYRSVSWAQRLRPRSDQLQFELAQFVAVAPYYTAESRKVLDHSQLFVSIDDVVTASMVATSDELCLLYEDAYTLRQMIASQVQYGYERHDQPQTEIIGDLEVFPPLELVKIYLWQQTLLESPALRSQIDALIGRDLEDTRSELGGVIRIDPLTGALEIEEIPPSHWGGKNSDNYYRPADPVLMWSRYNFSGFHLHAFSGDDTDYAGPSTPDLAYSSKYFGSTDVVITPCGERCFNVHYYFSEDGKSAYAYNLGVFFAPASEPLKQ